MNTKEEEEQKEQIKQVLGYLSGNAEERETALGIVLAYSTTRDHRRLFDYTEAVHDIMKLVQTENPSIFLALKCLINFSADMTNVREMCKYNIATRLYDVLKENVRQDLKNEVENTSDTKGSAKENQAEGIFELVRDIRIDPKTGKMVEQDRQEQIIECCFMLLSNITAHECGQKHVLGIEKEGSKF
jgi:hypothetical protein